MGIKKGTFFWKIPFGADDQARTDDLNLGKVALYQLSYIRIFAFRSANISAPFNFQPLLEIFFSKKN